MADTATLITVAVSALGVAGSALGIVKMVLTQRQRSGKVELGVPTVGRMTVEALERTVSEIVSKNSNDNIMPLLRELKEVSQKQVEIQQKQNEILVELVTVSRIGQRRT